MGHDGAVPERDGRRRSSPYATRRPSLLSANGVAERAVRRVEVARRALQCCMPARLHASGRWRLDVQACTRAWRKRHGREPFLGSASRSVLLCTTCRTRRAPSLHTLGGAGRLSGVPAPARSAMERRLCVAAAFVSSSRKLGLQRRPHTPVREALSADGTSCSRRELGGERAVDADAGDETSVAARMANMMVHGMAAPEPPAAASAPAPPARSRTRTTRPSSATSPSSASRPHSRSTS